LISYEQKSSANDNSKIAKTTANTTMAQDKTFPTDGPPLSYTV
jgi:hypothetical protein